MTIIRLAHSARPGFARPPVIQVRGLSTIRVSGLPGDAITRVNTMIGARHFRPVELGIRHFGGGRRTPVVSPRPVLVITRKITLRSVGRLGVKPNDPTVPT